MKTKETIVLVHGAWDSSYTWRKVKPMLEAKGHEVVAIDMPGHGDDIHELAAATFNDYVETTVNTLSKFDKDVILVGHSMGGVVISNAAEKMYKRIKKLIYIAAFMLETGESANGTDGRGIIPFDWHGNNPNRKLAELASTYFDIKKDYPNDLKRPFKYYESIDALYGKASVSQEAWGSIPKYYISTLNDRALPTHLQEKMYSRFKCEKIYKMHTSHAPQIQAPELLVEYLLDILGDKESA